MRIADKIGLFLCLIFSACLSTKSVKDGRTAYNLKQYATAIQYLESEVASLSDTDEEYPQVSYLLGESYKNINDSQKSLTWYIQAAKTGYGPDAFYEMAYMLKKNERYQDAILSFNRLLKMFPQNANDIKKEIEKCQIAQNSLSTLLATDMMVSPLTINTEYAEYAPSFYNGTTLLFTSDRLTETSSDIYAWTGNGYSDIYQFDLIEGTVSPFDVGVNSEFNDGVIAFNQKRDQAYFTRCFSETGDQYCRIMTSVLDGDSWSEPIEALNHKPMVNYGDPMLIENDSVLLFVSNDPTGFGGHDLYYALLEEDGIWSEPELMPSYLNTIGDERFPTWQNDTLYYASDFLPGLGGLDIFKTALLSDNSWSRPINIGKPFNSPEDDYGYIIAPDEAIEYDVKSKVYFTTTRGVFGNDDIYVGIRYKTDKDYQVVDTIPTKEEEVEVVEVQKNLFLQVTVTEKIFASADNPNSYVVGKRHVPGASIKFSFNDVEELFISNEQGQILLPIDTGIVYSFLVGKADYLNNGVDYRITKDYEDLADGELLEMEIEIEKIFEGVEIVLDNIYYDYNESYIREDARPSLDYLVKTLVDNPALNIELSSHTDCRGEEEYNLDLSQRRAQAAVEYIISQADLRVDQLSSSGYGESNPEIECAVCDDCSEDEHQINRRTTFTILK